MKKKVFSALLALGMAASVILSGCGSSAASSEAAAPASSEAAPASSEAAPASSEAAPAGQADLSNVKVDLLVKKLSSSFWTDLDDYAHAQAEEYGWDLETLCPEVEDNNESQIEILEQSLVNPPDIYIIAPADSQGITPIIEKINAAGIPIICIDGVFADESLDYVTFVGANNYENASLGAQKMVDALGGKGKIVILEGTSGATTCIERMQGANDVFSQYPDIEILASQPADWNRQTALTVTQNFLTAYPDLEAIFAINGEMALGAVEACRQAGRTDVKISGMNNSAEITQAILDGRLTFTIDDASYDIGKESVVACYKYLSGETLEKRINVDAVPVDETNVAEFAEKYGL